VLKGFQGTVEIGFGNRPMFGIYDDRAHGTLRVDSVIVGPKIVSA